MRRRPRPVSLRRIGELYRTELANARRELLFVSGVSFFVTFAVTRGVTQAILRELGPFRNVRVGGLHIHHHILGLLMLIGSGHSWLHLASVRRRDDRRLLRLATIVYAAGSALTLDEFALALHLDDVYWDSPGREIIDGSILVISLGSIGVWGAPFFRALAAEVMRGGPAAPPAEGWLDRYGPPLAAPAPSPAAGSPYFFNL